MEWYVAVDNQPKMIPETVLKHKIENNEVLPDALVVNAELKNWTPLRETELWKQNAPKMQQGAPTPAAAPVGGTYSVNGISNSGAQLKDRGLALAIIGWIFAIIGFFILPIIFSVLGFIFGLIAFCLNPAEEKMGVKPIWKFKSKAKGFGLAAMIIGGIGVVLMIINMVRFSSLG